MPAPLNTRSAFKEPNALVVVRGDDYNRLFRVWQMVMTGQLQVIYASEGVSPGFAIPADLSARVQLILPPPSAAALAAAGFTSEQVTFYDKNCNPVVRTVLTQAPVAKK